MWRNSILIIIQLLIPRLIQSQASTMNSWRSLNTICVASNTPAFNRSPSVSEIHCVTIASQVMPGGLSVAQFNSASKLCSTFSYQSVCRQLVSGSGAPCLTFVRFPIDIQSINSKLTNLWLADDLSRLENLVCQIDAETNRFYPVNTIWTSEGLKFDGTSSHMILNKTSIGFSGGLTWLLRIKRTPQVQVYFEFNSCSTLGSEIYGAHMWELDYASRVYFRPDNLTGTKMSTIFSALNQMSSNPEHWLNIAFTTNSSGNPYYIFYNGSILDPSGYSLRSPIDGGIAPATLCIMFGRRIGDSRMFSGTLGAFAFANASMSEAEIQQFFASVA